MLTKEPMRSWLVIFNPIYLMPKMPNNNPDVISEMFESEAMLCMYNYRPKEKKDPSIWLTVPPHSGEDTGKIAGGCIPAKDVDGLAMFLLRVNDKAREAEA